MELDARTPAKPAGILYDHGSGRRIPYARWFDTDTGKYEAFAVAPNGVDILCNDDGNPIVIRGRAVGRLELLPIGHAHQFNVKRPEKVQSIIEPMCADEKREGLDQYKKVYNNVWQWRGESRRCVDQRWACFLEENSFLDAFILKRRYVGVSNEPGRSSNDQTAG